MFSTVSETLQYCPCAFWIKKSLVPTWAIPHLTAVTVNANFPSRTVLPSRGGTAARQDCSGREVCVYCHRSQVRSRPSGHQRFLDPEGAGTVLQGLADSGKHRERSSDNVREQPVSLRYQGAEVLR